MIGKQLPILKDANGGLSNSAMEFHQQGPARHISNDFFGFSLTSLSRLFHSYRDEPIGRWGETGVPRENHLTHPQAKLGLSHMWPVRGSNLQPVTDDRMIKSAEIQRPYPLGHGGRPVMKLQLHKPGGGGGGSITIVNFSFALLLP